MSNKTTEMIDKLTDAEIKTLIENDDLGSLLQPIKHNPKHYAKYNPSCLAMLGRMDKKSIMVKTNLPKLVFDFYKKGEPNYCKYLENLVRKMRVMLKEILQEVYGADFDVSDVNQFDVNDYSKVFQHILEDKNSKLIMNLFYLQLKLYDVEIDDELKREIENEWERLNGIQVTKKELAVTLTKEFEEKEEEARQKYMNDKDVLKKQIIDLNAQVKKLQRDLNEKENDISLLKTQIGEKNIKISTLQDSIQAKITENNTLQSKMSEERGKSDLLDKALKKKTQELYAEISELWEKENEPLLQNKKMLEEEIVIHKSQVQQLQSEIEQKQEQIKKWDEYAEQYVEHLDQKIIDKKIESILLQQIDSKDSVKAEERTAQAEEDLFVISGSIQEELEPCNDYYDYRSVAEENLVNAGEKMYTGLVIDLFNAALNIGLCPLICGFNARRMALALTAARYGEKSEIISIPVGFNKTKVLLNKIEKAQTRSIIIEDAFGTLNEKVLLPILRSCVDKKLIFTAEHPENLQYVPRYFYNYMQLIVIDKQTNMKSNQDIYAKADHVFKKIEYSSKDSGHKLARYLFNDTSIENPYAMQRGSIFTELEQECTDNSEEDIIKKYFISEARWILSEEDREKMANTIEGDGERFPSSLAEVIRR